MQIAEDEIHNSSVEVIFAGEKLILDGDSVIYLPNYEALLVSDLHFEKASYFAARRNPLPLYDTMETLERLENVIKKYQPKQIICLGDSFHDYNAQSRINNDDADRLNQLCHGSCDWIWILGNHDKYFPSNIKGRQVDEFEVGNINLSHERSKAEFEIIGHFHPKASISVQRHNISGRAFIHDKNLMIMPSFGAFTGGLYTDSPQIGELFISSPKTYMIYNKKIWRI